MTMTKSNDDNDDALCPELIRNNLIFHKKLDFFCNSAERAYAIIRKRKQNSNIDTADANDMSLKPTSTSTKTIKIKNKRQKILKELKQCKKSPVPSILFEMSKQICTFDNDNNDNNDVSIKDDNQPVQTTLTPATPENFVPQQINTLLLPQQLESELESKNLFVPNLVSPTFSWHNSNIGKMLLDLKSKTNTKLLTEKIQLPCWIYTIYLDKVYIAVLLWMDNSDGWKSTKSKQSNMKNMMLIDVLDTSNLDESFLYLVPVRSLQDMPSQDDHTNNNNNNRGKIFTDCYGIAASEWKLVQSDCTIGQHTKPFGGGGFIRSPLSSTLHRDVLASKSLERKKMPRYYHSDKVVNKAKSIVKKDEILYYITQTNTDINQIYFSRIPSLINHNYTNDNNNIKEEDMESAEAENIKSTEEKEEIKEEQKQEIDVSFKQTCLSL